MALQLSGTSKQELERLWAGCKQADPAEFRTARADAGNLCRRLWQRTPPAQSSTTIGFSHSRSVNRRPPSVIATGPFDDGRFIARLPGPPYQFLDRITRIDAKPWVMVPGGSAEAQFDVVPDAWYFSADRQDRMPFARLARSGLAGLRLDGGLHGVGLDQRRRSQISQPRGDRPPAPARHARNRHAHDPHSRHEDLEHGRHDPSALRIRGRIAARDWFTTALRSSASSIPAPSSSRSAFGTSCPTR